ncbi:MAG: voltage-gated potassium channel [Saprospiraceae bacterium]|jgi:voltage-gated potassium channel
MLKIIKQISFLEYRQKVANKFLWLLLPLAGLIFLPSFVTGSTSKDILIYACLGMVLLAGVFILSETKQKLFGAVVLALITLTLNMVSFSISNQVLFLLRMVSLMLFFGWLLIFVFSSMARTRRISENIIFGAVDGYLLLGILGGFGFRIIHFFYPGSFAMPAYLERKLDVFTYFSFVTLTNLGYGDISPLTPPSQAMALFLAISGQMYLAIIIGILVGKFILFRSKSR